jgi:hypothetical protein
MIQDARIKKIIVAIMCERRMAGAERSVSLLIFGSLNQHGENVEMHDEHPLRGTIEFPFVVALGTQSVGNDESVLALILFDRSDHFLQVRTCNSPQPFLFSAHWPPDAHPIP